MTINVNGRSINEIIQEGQPMNQGGAVIIMANPKANTSLIAGFPTGKPSGGYLAGYHGGPSDVPINGGLQWESPNPFGIMYKNIDISLFYIAKNIDYYNDATDVAIPSGVNMLKVICVGGSGGGSGANGGNSNEEKTETTQVRKGYQNEPRLYPRTRNEAYRNADVWNQSFERAGTFVASTWNALTEIKGNWQPPGCNWYDKDIGWGITIPVRGNCFEGNWNVTMKDPTENVPYYNAVEFVPSYKVADGNWNTPNYNKERVEEGTWNEEGYNTIVVPPIRKYGTIGKKGTIGDFVMGQYPITNQTKYSISIGKGGKGGAIAQTTSGNTELLGESGENGGDTIFTLGNDRLVGNGGAGGKSGTDPTSKPMENYSKYRLPESRRMAGNAGIPVLPNPCYRTDPKATFPPGAKMFDSNYTCQQSSDYSKMHLGSKSNDFFNRQQPNIELRDHHAATSGSSGLCRVYFLY
jgi:hypothetical protein